MASTSELQPIVPAPDSGIDHTDETSKSEQAPITEDEIGEYREQDRYLPIANISRIMKQSVPHTAKIAKDAKECVQECVSEFISFVTSEAAERAGTEKRKTIGGEDILNAMSALGFDNYVETLKIHLARLRQEQSGGHGHPQALAIKEEHHDDMEADYEGDDDMD